MQDERILVAEAIRSDLENLAMQLPLLGLSSGITGEQVEDAEQDDVDMLLVELLGDAKINDSDDDDEVLIFCFSVQ